MIAHSIKYKEELLKLGRRIRQQIWVYNNYNLATEDDNNLITENNNQLTTEQINQDDVTIINNSDIFSIDIINQGNILKSLMKQCNINIKQELNLNDEIEVVLELLIDEENDIWELVTYDKYIVYSKEYNFDTKSWSYVCYDKMLYAMKIYEPIEISYPSSLSYYIEKIAEKIGLGFWNLGEHFTNYNQLVYSDVYKNQNVTYRDIFDDISEIVGGNICVNADSIEIKYPSHTYNFDHQLIDFESLEVSNTAKLSYNFQNDNLTLNNSGNNVYCYQDITMLFFRNNGKVLRFDFDEITQNPSFAGDIAQLHIYYNDNTMQQITLLTRNKQISTYTIPNNTLNIIKVDFVIYANNSNTEITGNMIIEKPYLHFGSTKEEYIPLTDDILDESCLKDINSYFGEKYGPVNKVTIKNKNLKINHSANNPSSIEENGETEVIINNNLLITEDNYQDIANNLLDRLKNISYYLHDIVTIGLGYYELLDMFNVKFENKIYPCLLLNSEFNITTGLAENIYTTKTSKILNEYTSSSEGNNIFADTINAKGNIYSNGQKVITEDDINNVLLKSNVYSIAEQKIGTWIDGKDIYRKVITYSNITLSSSTTLSNSIISNLDTFTSIKIMAKQVNNGNWQSLSKAHSTNLDWVIGYYYNATNGFIIEAGAEAQAHTNYDIYIIVEYTKI